MYGNWSGKVQDCIDTEELSKNKQHILDLLEVLFQIDVEDAK